MGGIVSQTTYSMEDVQRIAGPNWCQEYYIKFMSVAVLQPIVKLDGTVVQEYRVGSDFVEHELVVFAVEQEQKSWTKKTILQSHNYAGDRTCAFTPDEVSGCTDSACQCQQGETVREKFRRSRLALQLQECLAAIPFYPNEDDMLDPDVYLFAEDPVPRAAEVCKEHGSLFMDSDYPPGAQLAGPFAGTHGSKPPYNFSNLRCFSRLDSINPPPVCMFDRTSGTAIAESIVQVDSMCGNSEIIAALGAVAGLYNGEYITSLINPSDAVSPYGLYSIKIRLKCANPRNEGRVEMVDAWILLDDFIPCDESGCMIFASAHRNQIQSAWASLFEKAASKLFGQSRGGYREIAHSPEYAGRLMQLLTGVECKEYDVMRAKDWTKLQRLLAIGQDCRIAAATVTKKDLRKSKALGIVTGVGVHGYTVLKAIEIKTKFRIPYKLLRLRNTWGRYEWQGPWSDESKEFKEHHKLLETSNCDDGSFWICVDDFSQLFQGIYAIVVPKNWNRHTVRTSFLHAKAELRNSHEFLDLSDDLHVADPCTEIVSPDQSSRFNPELVRLVKHARERRVTYDVGAPVQQKLATTGEVAVQQEASKMNSEKPRSTKGPKVIDIPRSTKMSTKSVKTEDTSLRESVKITNEMDEKSSADKVVEEIADAFNKYGSVGRRLPRERRNTFIF